MNVSELLKRIIYSAIRAVSPRGQGRKYDTEHRQSIDESGRGNRQFVSAV